MQEENMIFTQSVTYTMTYDRITKTTMKSLESVDENGARKLRGFVYARIVQDLYVQEDITDAGKAA